MTCSKHSNETFHTFKRHDDSIYKLALLGEAELQLRHWEVMKLINIASSLRNRSFRCTVVSIVALGRYRNPYRLINTLYLPCTELGIMNKRIGCTNWRRPHEVWRWSLQIVKPSSLEYQDGCQHSHGATGQPDMSEKRFAEPARVRVTTQAS